MHKRPVYVPYEGGYVYYKDCIWEVTGKAIVHLEGTTRWINLYRIEHMAGKRPNRYLETVKGVVMSELAPCDLSEMQIIALAASDRPIEHAP